ncbi:MAG: hypothetical protein V7L14_14885 [Nostoc sp.]
MNDKKTLFTELYFFGKTYAVLHSEEDCGAACFAFIAKHWRSHAL